MPSNLLLALAGMAVAGMAASIYLRPERWIDSLIVGAVLLFTCSMASRRPARVVDVLIITYTFNRLVRRLIDWHLEDFTWLPIISMLPPLIAVGMGLVALPSFGRWSGHIRSGLALIAFGLFFALLIGAKNGVGAIAEAVTWSSPVGVMVYVLWLRPSMADIVTWSRTFVIMAVAAVAYGWVQYLLLPPWDQYYVENASVSSLGLPIAGEVRFFGPGNVPDQLGYLCVIAVAVLFTGRVFNKAATASCVIFLLIGLAMTQARTVAVVLVLVVLLYALMGKLQDKLRFVVIGGLAFAALMVALPSLPGGQAVYKRFASFANLSEDGSVNGRLEFSKDMLKVVARRPLGEGFGRTGIASSVGSVQTGEVYRAFDNGYLQFFFTLGWIGTFCFLLGLYRLWLFSRNSLSLPEPYVAFARVAQAVFLGFMIGLAATNWFDAPFAIFFWLLLGIALHLAHVARSVPAAARTNVRGRRVAARPAPSQLRPQPTA